MIVISGALVVVALVLLVIGLAGGGLTLVYCSIGVSLLSFVFLVIGILQRRKELPAADAAAPAVPAAAPTAAEDTTVTTLRPVPAATSAEDAPSGSVLVVEGRPRYHVEGCRYLTGKDAESVDVAEARAQGFTACGVCKPDDALAAPAAEQAAEPVEDDAEESVAVVAAPARPRTAAARPAARPAARTAAQTAAATRAPAKKAPAKKAAVKKAAAVKAPAKTVAAPAKKAAAKAPAKKAAAVKRAAPAKAPAKKAAAKKAPAQRA